MRFPWSGPEHCGKCGDAFVRATYTDGFDRRTGAAKVKAWSKCPRSSDRYPEYGMYGQIGACQPPPFFACAIQKRAYYEEHRPYWTACTHASVSDEGDRCWDKAGNLITGVELAK